LSWFKKDPLQIIIFHSYGDETHFHCRGRALEDEVIDLSRKSYIGLLINSWKRFETDEIEFADLQIKLPNNICIDTKADDHGYFTLNQPVSGLENYIDAEGWLNFEVSYVNIKRTIQNSNKFSGQMLIPSKQASFGVISDIDDTILHTGVVSNFKWQVIYNTIFRPVSKRIPLSGASEFYHQLHRGSSGKEANPIFYVSHSPWNLYRYLEFFLTENNFPKGPILLRSFKTIFKRKEKGEKPQKQKEIVQLLKAYPKLSFILIGDSGERDPDIYIEIAKQFPNRIKAIYLRTVKHKKKIARIEKLIQEFNEVPMLLVKDSEHAIKHAREMKFLK